MRAPASPDFWSRAAAVSYESEGRIAILFVWVTEYSYRLYTFVTVCKGGITSPPLRLSGAYAMVNCISEY